MEPLGIGTASMLYNVLQRIQVFLLLFLSIFTFFFQNHFFLSLISLEMKETAVSFLSISKTGERLNETFIRFPSFLCRIVS